MPSIAFFMASDLPMGYFSWVWDLGFEAVNFVLSVLGFWCIGLFSLLVHRS